MAKEKKGVKERPTIHLDQAARRQAEFLMKHTDRTLTGLVQHLIREQYRRENPTLTELDDLQESISKLKNELLEADRECDRFKKLYKNSLRTRRDLRLGSDQQGEAIRV